MEVSVKKLLVAIFCLTSCAAASDNSLETMAPLPTTGINMSQTAKNTAVITASTTYPPMTFPEPMDPTVPFTPLEKDYIEYFRGIVDTPVSNQDILSWSYTWCDFMDRGMNKTNVTSWIQEMASDNEEAWSWLVSAEASARFFCTDQYYKWNP